MTIRPKKKNETLHHYFQYVNKVKLQSNIIAEFKARHSAKKTTKPRQPD